ncbi:DUF2971 domain-containing protein [Vibrio gigantis]|uniref:DUF2971 domain-containing protein n=1 Tax=Vibrio gigantis TaxID=296199 RepID=UPI001EFA36B7|nr:DUF2971 domain-containing protein [Vibrio gigantis]ULN65128.1 DUF2971 domain-containing protein [Vibrio gigantis]
MDDSPKLYRFFSDNLDNFTALSSSYLWFSNVEAFNDPFEGCISDLSYYVSADEYCDKKFIKLFKNSSAFSFLNSEEKEKMLLDIWSKGNSSKVEFKRSQLEVFEKAHKNTVSTFLQEYRWCCFSQPNPEIKSPLSSRLMWSHYANGLRGFLVEFDKEELINSLDHHYQGDVLKSEMIYDDLQPMNFFDDLAELVENNSPTLGKLLSLKSNDWRYEAEFRIGTKNSIVNYNPKVITRIIIGEKMTQRCKDLILSIIRGRPELNDVLIEEAYIDRYEFTIKTRSMTNS